MFWGWTFRPCLGRLSSLNAGCCCVWRCSMAGPESGMGGPSRLDATQVHRFWFSVDFCSPSKTFLVDDFMENSRYTFKIRFVQKDKLKRTVWRLAYIQAYIQKGTHLWLVQGFIGSRVSLNSLYFSLLMRFSVKKWLNIISSMSSIKTFHHNLLKSYNC